MTLQEWLESTARLIEESGVFLGHGTDNSWDEALHLTLPLLDIPFDADPAVLQRVLTPAELGALQAARERLGFDEIFYLQMGVLRQKRDWKSVEARRFSVPDEWLGSRLSALPFTLTNVQQKAIKDIRADFDSGTPMNRLLQGDVGSGKTVVAAMAAAMIVQAGAQAAIMSPTSILAEQHYRNFTRLPGGGVQVTSRVSVPARRSRTRSWDSSSPYRTSNGSSSTSRRRILPLVTSTTD